MIWRCDLLPQYKKYAHEIDAAIKRVLSSGRYVLGSEVENFEREFGEFLGTSNVISVGNGTDGLTLSLLALGIGPGDEVITTPFTAIPTVSAIIAAGAKPVFSDIDQDTFLMDLKAVKQLVGSQTKAVMPVHLFGNVVDIEQLRSMLPPHVAIIEDASQAHGSTINQRYAGTMGHMGVFSFYPSKNLGAYGDGGAIVTDDPAMAQKLRLLRMYGMVDKDHIVINGINSRLDELQAAILRVKLKYLNDMNQARQKIALEYRTRLSHHGIEFQFVPTSVSSNYHVMAARVSDRKRDKLIDYLGKRQIQTNIYYVLPIHLQEANRSLGYKEGDFSIAECLSKEIISLPMYPELESETLNFIIQAISEFAMS